MLNSEGTDAVVLCPVNLGTNPPAIVCSGLVTTHHSVTNERIIEFPENGQLRIQNIRIEDSGDYQCLLVRDHLVIGRKTIRVEVLLRSEFAQKMSVWPMEIL